MKNIAPLNPALPRRLLQACPAYQPSPCTTQILEGRSITIKDETNRMGLGAFKALGGVYAVAQLIGAQFKENIAPPDFTSDRVRKTAQGMTFVCASAGNHGMAVAAGARIFGAQARIHLAHTVPEGFAIRLRAQSATVVRSGNDYQASVEAAIQDAAQNNAIHLADGSWPGYTEPPRLVMEGYTVIAEELREQFEATSNWPSHVYLQAGVGGLAAAIAFMIRSSWAVQPEIIIVEPDAAPCLRDSKAAGQLVTVTGPDSNMGRLDCKTPSMLAFETLREAADRYVTLSDEQAQQAVITAKSMGFSTTPSGVAGLAVCLAEDAPNPLVILSEGDIPDA